MRSSHQPSATCVLLLQARASLTSAGLSLKHRLHSIASGMRKLASRFSPNKCLARCVVLEFAAPQAQLEASVGAYSCCAAYAAAGTCMARGIARPEERAVPGLQSCSSAQCWHDMYSPTVQLYSPILDTSEPRNEAGQANLRPRYIATVVARQRRRPLLRYTAGSRMSRC